MMHALLLDFYGTLVHEDDDIVAEICAEVADQCHPAITAADVGRVWSKILFAHCRDARGDAFVPQRILAERSLRETVVKVGSEADSVTLSARQCAQWTKPDIFPEARAFLDGVRRRGIPVCVISNIDRADIVDAMAHHSIEVDHLITSEDVRSYKPNPELFEAALETLGLAPEHVVHVGDSRTSDVAGAHAMGIPVAWINRTNKPAAPDNPATWVVRDLEQAMRVLGIYTNSG